MDTHDDETTRLRAEVAALRARLEATAGELAALHASEGAYRELFERAGDALFVSDEAGRYQLVNESAERLLGYTRDELLSLSIADLVPAEDLQRTPLALEALRAGRTVHSRRRMRCKDGSLVLVDLTGSMLPDGRLYAIVRDATERLRAERALRESQTLLHEIGSNLRALFWVRDLASGALLYANPAWDRLLPEPPRIGEHYSQLFGLASSEDRAALRERRADATDFDGEVHVVDRDGGTRWYHVRTFAVSDGDGMPYRVVGVGHEITETRAALEALRRSEETYRNLFENAPVAIYRGRLDGAALLDANRSFCELFAASREELLRGPPPAWLAPEDRAEIYRMLRDEGGFTNLEVTVRVGGEVKTVIASATAYRELGYFEGTLVDITARARAQAALRETEARFALVFATTSDIQVLARVANMRFVVIAVNDAFRGLAAASPGIDPDAMVGRGRSEMLAALGLPPDEVERELPAYRRAVETGASQRYEISAPWAGRTLHLDVRIEPIVGADGGVTHVLYSARDITERKLAEEATLASLREKEALLHEIHHRVKNNLQIVSSLLYVQAVQSGEPRLAALLHESRSRITTIALVHQMLYQSRNLAQVSFERYGNELLRFLHDAHGIPHAHVRSSVTAGDLVLQTDLAIPCGLILHELVSNAFKHAFPDARPGSLSVALERGQDGLYGLLVEDDGVGLPADVAERAEASLGLKLIDRLVAQLQGTLERSSSERGTRCLIRFPDLEASAAG